jgi:glycosyltransferase involved in cell wall biosynthesis
MISQNKVWMLIPTYNPVFGGAQSQLKLLSGLLLEDGREVEIVTRRHIPIHKNLASNEIVHNVRVSRVFSKGLWKFGAINFIFFSLVHILKTSKKNQNYHVHSTGSSLIIAVIANIIRPGKIILKFRSGVDTYQEEKSIFDQFINILIKKVHTLLVLNDETGDLLSEKFSKSNIVKFNNGVDTDIFKPLNNYLQTKIEYKNSHIIYTGRLEKKKGVLLLCNAFEKLYAKHKDISLELIGSGSLEGYILDLSKKLNNSIKVSTSTNIVKSYQNADIFVLASFSEGMSNSLLEAMACGLIVVSSNVGAAEEIINHGDNGFLFENKHLENLVEIIESVLMENYDTKKIRKQSVKTMRNSFSNKYLVSNINKIYI